MMSLGLALIQCDWHPYKKRKSGPRQRGETIGRHREGMAKERGLRRNQLCQHLDFGLPEREL